MSSLVISGELPSDFTLDLQIPKYEIQKNCQKYIVVKLGVQELFSLGLLSSSTKDKLSGA